MNALSEYRRKRNPRRTPEPFNEKTESSQHGNRFVVQEHHARRLHWDFRLERDGVLVSWALPRGIPASPHENHLAVQTEDHPLDYADFEGEIPEGEYGAGQVLLWDRGKYATQKWTDREVKVVLEGSRVQGLYVLFKTRGKNWMIHRMDPPSDTGWTPLPETIQVMVPKPGKMPPTSQSDKWAYEFGWHGLRTLVYVSGGRAVAKSSDKEITQQFPELREMAESLGSTQTVLDGEIVSLDGDGHPVEDHLSSRMNADTSARIRRASKDFPSVYLIYDVLHLDGHLTIEMPYVQRRELLDQLTINGAGWQTTPWIRGNGRDVMQAAKKQNLRGIVAKKLDSPYRPGEQSGDWLAISIEPRRKS